MEENKLQQLQDNLLMFYLGNTRSASNILSEQKENTINDEKKVENLHKMVNLSRQLKRELIKGNIDAMGDILHRGWTYKKELASKISNRNYR